VWFNYLFITDVYFKPDRIYQAILNGKIEIKQNDQGIELDVGNVISIPVPEVVCSTFPLSFALSLINDAIEQQATNEKIKSLEDKVVRMNSEISDLKQQVKILEDRLLPVVLHLSTTGGDMPEGRVKWDIEKIPLNTRYFLLSSDSKRVTIVEKGVYRFDVQLLNVSGQPVFPFLYCPEFSLYGYGSGNNYQTGDVHAIFEVPANTTVEVGLQNSTTIYRSGNGNTHSFCIQKL
jgi:hypothetical protein